VDIEARKDGRCVAVEAETEKADATSNIEKDLAQGYDAVLTIAVGKSTLQRIRRLVAQHALPTGGESLIMRTRDVERVAEALVSGGIGSLATATGHT